MTANLTPSLLRTNVGFVCRLALACMVSGLTWLSHLAVALVFAIGVPPTGNPRAEHENENELSIEGAEDSEVSRGNGLDAQRPRRLRAHAGAAARELESPSAPRTLAPRRTQAPRPSWQHPRRSIPPDEDDEALG
jgi:hypothetical protein